GAKQPFQVEYWFEGLPADLFDALYFSCVRFGPAIELRAPVIAAPTALQALVLKPIDVFVGDPNEAGLQRGEEIVVFVSERDGAQLPQCSSMCARAGDSKRPFSLRRWRFSSPGAPWKIAFSSSRTWQYVRATTLHIENGSPGFSGRSGRQNASVACAHFGRIALSKRRSCGVICAKPSSHRPAMSGSGPFKAASAAMSRSSSPSRKAC